MADAPNKAGIRASFKASLGKLRAKDIDRIAGTMCNEYAPGGQARCFVSLMPAFALSRPPAGVVL